MSHTRQSRRAEHPAAPSESTTADKCESKAIARKQRRRRARSWRLPTLDSGRSDPWWYPGPGERGYEDAAGHLLDHGLTPAPNLLALRSMWKAGSDSRRVAQVIVERWEPVA